MAMSSPSPLRGDSSTPEHVVPKLAQHVDHIDLFELPGDF